LFPYSAGQFGSGANMAFDATALQRIGGFDPLLGAGTAARGGDDLAAFTMVIKAGYQLVYQPGAIVWHHHRREETGIHRQAYGYGMGLGAFLTKLVIDSPSTWRDLIAALPEGLSHMFSPTSPKNRRLPSDYPRRLVWRERVGILAGAAVYLANRNLVKTANPTIGLVASPTSTVPDNE